MSSHQFIGQALCKRYGERTVLSGVSLAVNSGEVVGLLGPNGAGKTTCFQIMVGLISADNGQIFLNDQEITREPIHIRARLGIGYLPQEPSVFRKLTVLENIMAVLELGSLSKKNQKIRAEQLLAEFRLEKLTQSRAFVLSGGERRRLEIARLMATNPQFVLLDEPFAGVDPLSVADIQAIIAHLKSANIGVLITDHNVRETLAVCHRAYIIYDGRVLIEGNPEKIFENEQVRQVYLGTEFKH